MCGSCDNKAHLDDDLGDIFARDDNAPARPLPTLAEAKQAVGLGYTEKCPACRGRGRFISYAGRDCGPCFKCKGKGTKTFATSPAQRAKSADKRAADRDAKRIAIHEAVKAFTVDFADDFAWMQARRETFEFANSMCDALTTYGSLTEKQHAAVTRLRLADEQRTAQRAVEAAQRAENAPVVTLAKIEDAFSTAIGKGIKRPKLRLDTFKFSLAPATGRNAGAIYVVDAAEGQYLGKIADGKFLRVRECNDDQEQRIVAAAADPHAAAIAYGQRTGNCCICDRELTNHASIDAGIGPICAGRMGWG